jgi:hypothetical protein
MCACRPRHAIMDPSRLWQYLYSHTPKVYSSSCTVCARTCYLPPLTRSTHPVVLVSPALDNALIKPPKDYGRILPRFCIQGTWHQSLVLAPPRITHTQCLTSYTTLTLLLSVSSLATAVSLWSSFSLVQGNKTGARLLFHPDCEMGICPSPWRLDLHNPSVHPALFYVCSKHVKTAHRDS